MAVLIPDAIERPTSKTPAVREKAVREFMPEVIEWLGDDAGDEEELFKQLSEVLNPWNDGYEAAKELERRWYWSVDAELVGILENFSDYGVKENAVKAWVIEVQPKPTFKLGDRVVWKRKLSPDIEGTITKIYAETAQYIVSKDGEAKGCGTYVNWEDAQGSA